jgi:hypothetical protein
MKITFHIITKGHRPIVFDSAVELDKYIKSTRLNPKSLIEMHNDNNTVGVITIKKYLELEKQTP